MVKLKYIYCCLSFVIVFNVEKKRWRIWKKVGRQWYVTRLKTKYTDINDRLYLLENLQYYGH